MPVVVVESEGIYDPVDVQGPCSQRVNRQKCKVTGSAIPTAIPQVALQATQTRKTALAARRCYRQGQRYGDQFVEVHEGVFVRPHKG